MTLIWIGIGGWVVLYLAVLRKFGWKADRDQLPTGAADSHPDDFEVK